MQCKTGEGGRETPGEVIQLQSRWRHGKTVSNNDNSVPIDIIPYRTVPYHTMLFHYILSHTIAYNSINSKLGPPRVLIWICFPRGSKYVEDSLHCEH